MPSISNESAIKSTGHDFDYWFDILDKAGARELGHTEIAAWLGSNHPISPWWAQMLTVEYERARKNRQVHQVAKGFSISVRRTICCSLENAWNAWADPEILSRWFTTGAKQDFTVGGRYSNNDHDSGTFKCITHQRHIRFTWENERHQPGSDVVLEFREIDTGKMTLSLTHEKLGSKEDADDLKIGWNWAMDCLKLFLETGNKIGFEEWQALKKKT